MAKAPKVRPLAAIVYVEIDGETFEVEFNPKEVDAIFFHEKASSRWDRGGEARGQKTKLKDIAEGKGPKGTGLSKHRVRKVERTKVPKLANLDDETGGMRTVGAMAADDPPPPPPNGEEGSLCWHEVNCTKWCLD